jgi:hypothetical protein
MTEGSKYPGRRIWFMQRSQFPLHRFSVLPTLALVSLLASAAWAGARESVIYRFTGGTGGAYPSSNLLLDASGHLYGTASRGGNTKDCSGNGCGMVFELTRSKGKWQEHVLYAFQGGTDGLEPSGNLVFDAAGNLYGTTYGGGTGTQCTAIPGCGTVFELFPKGDGSWKESVLYSFQDGGDGALPVGLTIDASGNLYGVNITGSRTLGAEFGTVFELSPPRQMSRAWKEITLYSFQAFEIQANPGLVFDVKGNLYGTWSQLYSCESACGAVFELKRAGTSWQETDLYDFPGGGNGGEPMAGIILDNKGQVYGTGGEGGNGWGIAFQLKLSGGQWTEVILHNFCSLNNCADGGSPQSPLVFDHAGNLYGTAAGGGTGCSFPGCGVVFKLARTKSAWKETVMYNFKGEPDGRYPVEGLTLDGKGNLYGTTAGGGKGANGGYGTVFELTP